MLALCLILLATYYAQLCWHNRLVPSYNYSYAILHSHMHAIFINDLPQCIHSAIPFIFADDTKCLLATKSTSDSDKLQQDINNIIIIYLELYL